MFTRRAGAAGCIHAEDLDARRQEAAARARDRALDYYRASCAAGARRSGRADVQAPTLVIWGERDHSRRPSVHLLDGLHEFAPDLTIRRLPDAGHWVHHEAPDEVQRALLAFLAG